LIKKATFVGIRSRRLLAFSLALVFGLNFSGTAALAAAASQDKPPGSTILLPLTPRIDTNELTADEQDIPSPAASGASTSAGNANSKSGASGENQNYNYNQTSAGTAAKSTASGDDSPQILESREPVVDQELPMATDRPRPETSNASTVLEAAASEDEQKLAEMNEPINEDDTIKGVIQIVADDTEYDQDKNTFLGTGNAVAIIGGQHSKLEADTILYDQGKEMIDARGNVKILRNGQLTSGSSFKFNVTSDEYLITNPDTMLNGSQIIARTAYGSHTGMIFKNGDMTMGKPFHIGKNVTFGPVGAGQDIVDRVLHPDAFVEDKPSFIFKARKMTYEKYNDGKLTLFGGRLDFGAFSVPLPKFIITNGVNGENHAMFPVTPMLTSNIQSGGNNIGPAFNYAIGKSGQFSWAPMVQFGGAPAGSGGSSLGLSGQVGYSNDRFSTHFAYGSNSKLPVADLKMPILHVGKYRTKGLKLQMGVNRYLTEGLFGFTRAHFIAELMDNHPLKAKIPFITGVNFRSSIAAAQDQAQLHTTSADITKILGGISTTTKTQPSAIRVEEQMTASTVNLFALGNERYGLKSYIFGGAAVGAYSSGQSRALVQYGPQMMISLNRFHFNTGYTQAAIRGSSPFYFDQYLQGAKSANIAGDVKVAKWLRIGGGYGYNLVAKAAYAKTVTAAFGPDDFKLLINRDVLNKVNRFGFDILYGQPVPFNKLVLKGSPDGGQLGSL
jgi:hypothetical protein